MPGKGERCREIKGQEWGVRGRYRKVMEIFYSVWIIV